MKRTLHYSGTIYGMHAIIRGGSRISSYGGAHLKKMRRAEGGANIFGVFRVKNQDFTPKNHNNRTPGRSIRPKSGSIRTDNYKYVGY